MVSSILYTGLIVATSVERLLELRVSKRHTRWSIEQGGQEYGQGHYPFMVVLHTGLLLACVAEVWLLGREFDPYIGYPMLIIAVLCQIGRWWCIRTLGPRWNTRVFIVPGLPPVRSGPYRWVNHPNYLIVATEGLVLPLIHGSVITASVFTVLNAALMVVRIRCENRALAKLPRSEESPS